MAIYGVFADKTRLKETQGPAGLLRGRDGIGGHNDLFGTFALISSRGQGIVWP